MTRNEQDSRSRPRHEMPERLLIDEMSQQSRNFSISRNTVAGHYPLHWHDFYEVELVIAGTGQHLFNGQVYTLSPGSLFLLTPADFHEMLNTSEDGQPLTVINLKFTEAHLPLHVRDVLLGHIPAVAELDQARFEWLHNACLQLLAEADAQVRPPYHQRMISITLEQLLIELARHMQRDPSDCVQRPVSKEESAGDPAIARALLFMQLNFHKPFSLEDAAKHVNLSPKYFSERFCSITGTSFVSYLQTIRLQFAAAMLSSTNMRVTDICLSAGFVDLSHFIRTFKRKFGCSPSLYRKAAVSQAPV